MPQSTPRALAARQVLRGETSVEEPHIPLSYVYALWEAESVGDIVTRLTEMLRQLGGDVARCLLVPPPAPVENERRVWQYPLAVDPYTLYVVWRTPPAPRVAEAAPVYIEMACRALEHLLNFQGIWPRWAQAVDRVEAPLEATAVLDALVAAFHEDLKVPHVRLFRFRENRAFCFLREATAAAIPLCHLQPEVIIPAEMVPTAFMAVETGDIQWFPPGEKEDVIVNTEKELLFPADVHLGLIVPFWLTTQEMGVITLGWDHAPAREWAQTFTSRALRFLLHHAALALERAELQERATRAYREATLMMEHALSGIILVSPKLRVVRANPAAAQLWELTPEQLRDRHLADLFGEGFLHVQSPLSLAQAQGQVGPVEWAIRDTAGNERYLLVTVVDVRGKAWPDAAYLVSVWDITERHRIERLKQRILAGVSHEMRTPLAAIKGYAEVLHSMGANVEPRVLEEGLRTVIDRATELEGLINVYLDLLHLEGGQYVVQREMVHLKSVLTLAVEQLRRTRERTPHVVIDVSTEVEYVYLDPRLLWHVVYQLLSNAVKFTPAEKRVKVSARMEGSLLHLQVQDEGEGIPADRLPRLFDKFSQGEEEQLGVGGSGLGLAIVKAAVAALAGQLRVESEPGVGTTFHILLPCPSPEET